MTTATDLLNIWRARGVHVRCDGDDLVVRGDLPDEEVALARTLKPALLGLLTTTPGHMAPEADAPTAAAGADDAAAGDPAPPLAGTGEEHYAQSALADEAGRLSPAIRFTLRETEDAVGDVQFLRSIRVLLEEWPGANRVVFRIITLEGGVHRLQWRAYASAALRRQIAHLLARRALSGATNRGADATAMSGRSGQSRPGYSQ